METTKMLLSVVFICLVNFWTMTVNEKNYIGEHRELLIIGTQEKDLNILGGKPFVDQSHK